MTKSRMRLCAALHNLSIMMQWPSTLQCLPFHEKAIPTLRDTCTQVHTSLRNWKHDGSGGRHTVAQAREATLSVCSTPFRLRRWRGVGVGLNLHQQAWWRTRTRSVRCRDSAPPPLQMPPNLAEYEAILLVASVISCPFPGNWNPGTAVPHTLALPDDCTRG
ncbi:hypothetical protein B0H13DRAFT_2333243 [Mycena leptocephala]|nr:hypothetical protein B0H13DRAFT_2333243 [Mycena leptocephala]